MRAGRADAAARLWRRAVRAARALDCSNELVSAPTGPPASPPRLARSRSSRGLVVHTRGVRVRASRRIADGLIRLTSPDLVVDVTRQCATVAGEDRSLEGLRLSLKVLARLLAAGRPLAAEALFRSVWGRRFNPECDRATLDYHVSVLRARLRPADGSDPVVGRIGGAYHAGAGYRYVLVDASPERATGRTLPLDARTLAERRVIDNHTLRELVGLSRVSALRTLRRLVATGLLVREGRGRGARYRVCGSTTVEEPRYEPPHSSCR